MISVWHNNSYGYPDPEVLNRLYAQNIGVLRTDFNGTVVIASDGKRFRIDCENAP